MSEKVAVGYVYFHQVKICNANSISSPLTYGFPAMTGFVGAIHALSRKMMADARFAHLSLGGVLVACYDCTPKVYRTSAYRDYTFTQTRNPLKKDGSTAPIIEEGKCDLVVSLAVEVLADDMICEELSKQLIQFLYQTLYRQRIAGGSVMGMANNNPVQYFDFSTVENIIPMLMPAFVLMDASDEFKTLINDAKAADSKTTALDVFLDVCTLHHVPKTNEHGGTTWQTQSIKKDHGWLVPMPMGYQAISEKFLAGEMKNARNPQYPSQYVEAVYGLGKWVYPHHLKDDIETAFWRQTYDENGLYLLTQKNEL